MKRFEAGLLGVAVLAGCAEWKTGGNIGGANMGVRSPGNRKGGIALDKGDVAVSPSGKFFVTVKDNQMVAGDVGSSQASTLDALPLASRLAFWSADRGEGIVVLGSSSVVSFDRGTGQVAWQRPVSGAEHLDVTPDGNNVVLSGPKGVSVRQVSNGDEVMAYNEQLGTLRDVNVTRDSRFILMTRDNNNINASLVIARIDNGEVTCTADTRNCAAETVLSEENNKAMMAPTRCQLTTGHPEPISVFSYDSNGGCQEQGLIPGYGPLAMTPDHKTIVAFLDRDAPRMAGDPENPAEVKNSKDRFHLMFLDPATLGYQTRPYGAEMPRYAMSPDGQTLLVDSPVALISKVEVWNITKMDRRVAKGLPMKLHQLTFSPDSTKAFAMEEALAEIDITGAAVKPVSSLSFPDGLNLTPDGNTLMFKVNAEKAVHFLDSSSGRQENKAAF